MRAATPSSRSSACTKASGRPHATSTDCPRNFSRDGPIAPAARSATPTRPWASSMKRPGARPAATVKCQSERRSVFCILVEPDEVAERDGQGCVACLPRTGRGRGARRARRPIPRCRANRVPESSKGRLSDNGASFLPCCWAISTTSSMIVDRIVMIVSRRPAPRANAAAISRFLPISGSRDRAIELLTIYSMRRGSNRVGRLPWLKSNAGRVEPPFRRGGKPGF